MKIFKIDPYMNNSFSIGSIPSEANIFNLNGDPASLLRQYMIILFSITRPYQLI